MKPKLLVILGPTGCGKTALSLEIAQRFNGEIISADSRQFYRGMDIGTEKITEDKRHGIPHHLIDIRNPDQTYTVAEFKADAQQLISEITSRGKLPIMAGGTGLYISAVIENYHLTPRGKTTAKGPELYDVLMLQPSFVRAQLYQRLNERVDEQIQNGLIDEVKRLAAHHGWDAPAMTGIDYRQYRPCLEGKATLKQCADKAKQANRNFAKRQITWFKRYADRIQIVNGATEAEKLIKKWI